jgi:hydrogenase-4 component B
MMTGWFLGAAVLGLGAGVVAGPRYPRAWLGVTLFSAVALLAAVVPVLAGAPAWDWRSGFLLSGASLHLRLDAVSALFLALLAVVAGAGTAYSHEYWSDRENPKTAPGGRRWWSSLVLCMACVLLASNGLHFLIAWELFTVSAYFLITLNRQQPEVRAAGWLYLAASHAGTLCLFAFFTLLMLATGGWDLGPLPGRTELAPLFWLALAGFGLKSGMFPLHIWLPSAHASAPSHVSAMMSGVSLKLGIYGLVRFSGWLPTPEAAGWVVLGLGAVSAVLGAAFALAQNDLKRLLAYCSVENVGIILIGLGAALLGAAHGEVAWGRLALAGALLHVWNHGLFKGLLFLGAGSVLHATGTREMSRLGGLWRVMPWTAGLVALGAVAISGLPPLNGFVSEWLVYLGLIEAVIGHGTEAWIALPATILLAVAGALALASFVKLGATVFLGAPRTHAVEHAHESGPWMRWPMVALAVLCVMIGLLPAAVWPVVARTAAVWQTGVSPQPTPEFLATLGYVQPALALLLGLGVLLLWRRSCRNGLRRGPTWDCGYAEPTARMQYTGGSLADLAGEWFGWLFRPELLSRRPRGFFPAEGLRVARVPETVLERILTPAGGVVLQVSTAVRRMQHGRLQYYILYLLLGLLALGLIAISGGKS